MGERGGVVGGGKKGEQVGREARNGAGVGKWGRDQVNVGTYMYM